MTRPGRSEEGSVSAVVVTWNSEADILSCLGSIAAQTHSQIEIIVVDNASSDRTVQLVREEFRSVRLIKMDSNSGFAHANNVGVMNSTGEYLLTVNPDVVLEPDYVKRIVGVLRSSGEEVGSATGKLLREDRLTLDSTGIISGLAVRFFDRGQGGRDQGQYDASLEILGPCAAAAVYKRAMLDDIKQSGEFFDSSFFAFLEDVDLALRARAAGWRSIYVPEAKAVHRRGGSGTRDSLVQFYALRNRLMLIVKDIPVSTLFAQIVFLAAYDLSRLLWVSVSNPLALSSYRQVLEEMSVLLEKRGEILKK